MENISERKVLIDLGLTASQVNVFTIMSRADISTAKSIWSTAKVGRQDIYRILLELQKLGLVEKVLATPSQYRAIPMAEAISILYQRKKEEITNLQTEALRQIETYSTKSGENFQDDWKCLMIPPKEPLALRIKQTYKRTQKNIDIYSTLKKLSGLLSMDMFVEAIERGIELRVIAVVEDENVIEKLERPFFQKSNFKIRYIIDSPSTAFGVYDKRECYITTAPNTRYLEACALWSNYPTIVKLLQSHFEMLWNIAEEMKRNRPKKKGQIEIMVN